MSKPCSICISPKRKEVDELLKDKKISIHEIAKAYPEFSNMLQVHRLKHLKVIFYHQKKKIPGSFGPASEVKTQMTPLSQENRIKIRDALDEFFNEEIGNYKNDLSDQKLGDKLDIPWKHIFNMREMIYGPIKEQIPPPKVRDLTKELTEVIQKLQEILKYLNPQNS